MVLARHRRMEQADGPPATRAPHAVVGVRGIKQQKKAPEIFSDTFFSYTIFMLKRSVLHESAHAPILEFFHAKCLLIYELDHVLLSP